MLIFRFKDFKVYKDAKQFRTTCKKMLRKFPDSEKYVMVPQIERALLSIVLNIAEGCAKRSDADFARFLETSTGSVNEVVAGFDAALDDGTITEEDFKSIEQAGANVVRQLGGFTRSLRTHRATNRG